VILRKINSSNILEKSTYRITPRFWSIFDTFDPWSILFDPIREVEVNFRELGQESTPYFRSSVDVLRKVSEAFIRALNTWGVGLYMRHFHVRAPNNQHPPPTSPSNIPLQHPHTTNITNRLSILSLIIVSLYILISFLLYVILY
jgi:hypothetical protein